MQYNSLTNQTFKKSAGVSQVALPVKKKIHFPMEETQKMRVQSLGWEDPQEKEAATHSSILASKVPWTEEPGGLQSTVPQRVRHN